MRTKGRYFCIWIAEHRAMLVRCRKEGNPRVAKVAHTAQESREGGDTDGDAAKGNRACASTLALEQGRTYIPHECGIVRAAGFMDRAVLWNAVEKIEKAKNAQFAREQNISLVREYVNRHFVAAGMCADICIHDKNGGNPAGRIDHRSYARQGIDQIPTVHLGVDAFQMEKRGIRTERGDLNREIEVTNQRLRQLKVRIGKLRDWLKEEAANTEPPTLADYIQDILRLKTQVGKSDVSQSLYNLKDAANMLNFLTDNNIMDMATLKNHIEQVDIYMTGQKSVAGYIASLIRGGAQLS